MAIDPAAGAAAVDRVLTQHANSNVKDEARVPGTEKNTRAVEESSSPQKKSKHSDAQDKAVKQTAEQLGQFMKLVSQDLNISVDSDLGQTVVKVVNRDDKQVIRQIPSEEILSLMKKLSAIAEKYSDDSSGLLIQDKA